MDKAQSDLIIWYKIETEFFQGHVRHTRYAGKAKNRNEKVKENWSNCGELGKGGFGVVHKQIERATGHCRAVKTIDKRQTNMGDYSRELLVMAILAKVCVFTAEGIFPNSPPPTGFSCCGLMVSFVSVRRYSLSFWDGLRSPRHSILRWNILRGATSPSISVLHYYKTLFETFQSRYSRVSK